MLFKHKTILTVLLLTCISAFLHFYNLNWGAPFYFHPDERNIAFSVSQLVFPGKFSEGQFNPHFFAYGSLPIYSIFFYGFLSSLLSSTDNPLARLNFEMAIQISRTFSALFATLLIPLLFIIGKKLKDEKTGLIAAFLATASTGIIQFAHFGTFEMWLTFFSVLLFWFCLEKMTIKTVALLGIISGTLVAVKISALVLLLIPIFLILTGGFKRKKTNQKKKLLLLFETFAKIILFLITAAAIYFTTNPFTISDFSSFQNSINYESAVATGKLPVFYTGEFFNTTPIIFQLLHVYPFLLNPLITFIFLISFGYIILRALKTKNFSYFILLVFYLALFLSQAILFVKWTRYMLPTLPFVFLIIGITFSDLTHLKQKAYKKFLHLSLALTGLTTLIFAGSYFYTAFVQPDTRVAALSFAQKTIAPNARILSEVYDLGIITFNNNYGSITLFNFYDLDTKLSSPELNQELTRDLEQSEYIFLPSQRILKTRLLNKERFSNAYNFYSKLLSGDLGFKKIYETPCDILCKITYLGDPVFSLEQTVNVFDRPTVIIFKKI